MKTLFSAATINGKHSQERSYDGRTIIKELTFSKMQWSLLLASSTLRTLCKQGSGCAGSVVSVFHAAEEFPWYLSPLVFSICACSPGAGQRIWSKGDWTAGGFHVMHNHIHCEQAWCFPLCASKSNCSVLRQRVSALWPGVHLCSLWLRHTACRVSCMNVQKNEKSAELHLFRSKWECNCSD